MDGSVETLGDWRLLRGCTLPGPLPSALAVVALHPRHGIALVDALPQLTPEAEPRLFQRLQQARFGAVYGRAWPPVRHLALHAEELARLPDVLAEAFLNQPAPEMPGGDAWLDTVTRALQPGLPLASAPSPSAGRMRHRASPARRWPTGLPWRLGWRRGAPLAALLLALGLAWALWPPAGPGQDPAAPVAATQPPRLVPEAWPGAPPPAPAEPTLDPPLDTALAVPPPPIAAAPEEAGAALAPAPTAPAPAFREAVVPPPPALARPAAVQPVVVRTSRRCLALVQRIQTGEEASEDELLRLHACRSGS